MRDGVERARSKLEYTPLAASFCQEPFTVGELRRVYEDAYATYERLVELGVARAASRDLQESNDAFINAVVRGNPGMRVSGSPQSVRISQRSGRRPGLAVGYAVGTLVERWLFFAEAQHPFVIVQDADLEYDPAEYPKLLQPILDGDADVVYGSRFAGFPRRVLYFWHSVGNKLLTLASNMVTNLNLTDMETCYKAFRTPLLQSIPIRSNRFGIEPEITIKLAQRQASIYEVPISYHGRTYEDGKKIGWKDAVEALYVIGKYAIRHDIYKDPGQEILHAFSYAPKFNKWMADTIRPFVGRRVLEIGSGTGDFETAAGPGPHGGGGVGRAPRRFRVLGLLARLVRLEVLALRPVRAPHDLRAVRREECATVVARGVGELTQVAAVSVHAPQLEVTAARRREDDRAVLRADRRFGVVARAAREQRLVRTVRVRLVDVVVEQAPQVALRIIGRRRALLTRGFRRGPQDLLVALHEVRARRAALAGRHPLQQSGHDA